jgi:hypothetical protein
MTGRDAPLVGPPGTVSWPKGELIKAPVIVPLEWMDPFVGCLPGDAESPCQFGYGGLVQLTVFEESLSLFCHGNSFPWHGLHLLHGKKPGNPS